MVWNSKVVWTEGMFMRPQHFQQQGRYIEHYIESRCAVLRQAPWGFSALQLDQQFLGMGKVGMQSAQGVFPDGTPFNFPVDEDAPSPLDIPENIHNVKLYLCLPLRRAWVNDVNRDPEPDNLARYKPHVNEVRDVCSNLESMADVEIGAMRMRLLLETDRIEDYNCMQIGVVVDSRADKKVVMEENFIPPVLDCHANPILSKFLNELNGLLQHRGTALAGRVSASGRGGASEIADFLMLQVVNRYEPVITHLTQSGVHPADFFRLALEMAGELSTFTSRNKRPIDYPAYRHDQLIETFDPVMNALRQSLSMVLEQNAVAIDLEERKYGIRVATITDRALLEKASFVLTVTAAMNMDDLRRQFPSQVKIGPVEQIRELVNLQLPGIILRALPVAPRQLPFHTGSVYFELDRSSDYWREMRDSGGFALHLSGDFPSIEMTLWAIKG